MQKPLKINAPQVNWQETTVSEDRRNAIAARKIRAANAVVAKPGFIQRVRDWLNSDAF